MTRFILLLLTALSALATQSQPLHTQPQPRNALFPLVTKTGGATAIYVNPNDHWLVKKAAALLQDDIERITGARPSLLTTLPATRIPHLIIIGSLDSSSTIQQLARNHEIPLDRLKGKWEAFAVQTAQKPLPNVDDALVITGSDRRGTAYGIFELSRRMGVSPWYWWADVPVRKQPELFFTGPAIEEGPPAVKYRGFFINDEAPALSGWAKEKFGGANHNFYEKVFELLLRLKGNYLWPAMWGNAFNDDDPLNPILASQYGIVMGTSHHEPMLRAQQEWKRFGSGPWDYEKNTMVLDSFWQKGIEHMDHHESIVTVGMRGDGDKPMEESSNIALLEKIVKDQRAIIQKVTGKPAAATPQSWALYKEVQDYYDKGMRVPDDVTLLLCDDNWGNVRKLPLPGEKPRGGGYGMYYHFDYVGGPRNYKWLNTNPIARVWEQLHLTKEYGDDRIWMVNVGDIKPMEFPISFFMDYAWNPSQWPADKLPAYTLAWATEQFGPEHAAPIAEMLTFYTMYNGRRKPELLSPDTYSLLNYREAQQVVAKYNALAAQALSIYNEMPAEYHDAYDQLILFPIQACANLNELYYTVAMNRLYAGQGRTITNQLADKASKLFTKDSLLSSVYNHELAGGKWNHMMDQTHIGYTYWQEPRYNKMPEVKTIDSSAATGPSWGVAVEGSASWWPGNNTPAALPNFNRYERSRHFIDLFSRTTTAFPYTITAADPWVKINEDKGTVDGEQQIWISIDWEKAPTGLKKTSTLSITGPAGDNPVSVKLTIDNPVAPLPEQVKGFIETDGYVSINAQYYTKAIATEGISWQTIPWLGRTLSGVQASPVTAPAHQPGGNSPHLEYQFYLFDTGIVHVQAYFSPILEFNRKPIHYGISIDDETPQIIDLSAGNEAKGTWDKMVSDNIRIALSTHTISSPGQHTLKFWLVDPAVVLQKIVVDAGGVKPSYLGPPESFYSPLTLLFPQTGKTQKGLKDYYKNYFPIGVAVSPRSISGPDSTLILRQFNSLTPENAMKMGPIHPEENRYNWKDADAIVDFAQTHGLRVRGHNLCWHQQTPGWLFKDAQGGEVTKEVLLQRLKDHITTVVNRYKGKIYAWDVVNEAVSDDSDSTKFLRNSDWYRICGDEFIAKAFEYAHAADPQAQLFYNDYNTERPEKRERVYRLLKQLLDAHVPITGVGLQAHWSIFEPSGEDLKTTIEKFSSLGLKVQITELDLSIYPWEKNHRTKRPDESDAYTPELQQRQADQYKKVFSIFREYKNVLNGVTFWNVTDRHTWLDEYPVPGRKNYPLLFDTEGHPKKAWEEVTNF